MTLSKFCYFLLKDACSAFYARKVTKNKGLSHLKVFSQLLDK